MTGQDGLRQRILDAAEALDAAATELRKRRRSVLELDKKGVGDLVAVDACAAALGAPWVEPPMVALADELAQYATDKRGRLRTELLGRLRRLATDQGLGFELVGQEPPTVALAPLTVEIDFEAGSATILFARETVNAVTADADLIVEARARAMATIQGSAVASEVFFDRLAGAYDFARVTAGLADAERVDVVDMLTPLAIMAAGVESWRSDKAPEPFPRYLLSYQLHRLRRDGLLARNGRRLDLGAATGGSARDKSGVIFLPTSATDGQYYRSVRLVSA